MQINILGIEFSLFSRQKVRDAGQRNGTLDSNKEKEKLQAFYTLSRNRECHKTGCVGHHAVFIKLWKKITPMGKKDAGDQTYLNLPGSKA